MCRLAVRYNDETIRIGLAFTRQRVILDQMKERIVLTRWVCGCILLVLLPGTWASARDKSIENAVQLLCNTKAIQFPEIEWNHDDASRQLFDKQLAALRHLVGIRERSLVPIVIPYLYYSDNYPPMGFVDPAPSGKRQVDLKSWAFHCPAMAVVCSMPDVAGPMMSKYILDPGNGWGFRMHTLEVLGTMYPGVTSLQQDQNDIRTVINSPATKALLDAIADGVLKPYPLNPSFEELKQ